MKKTITPFSAGAAICFLMLPALIRASTNQATVAGDSVKFICGELLGRPTNNSITMNLCADKDVEVYVEYGTQSSVYTKQSQPNSYPRETPFNIIINNLTPDSIYYYRVRYRMVGTNEFLQRREHSFKTQRTRGSTFTFAVEADPHLDYNTNPELLKQTLLNVAAAQPDFLIDLGDTFMSEKEPVINPETILQRHLLLRTFFDLVNHSVPLFLALGNHEGEQGWRLNGTPDNFAVWATNIRKKHYPNPEPDPFYSGSAKNEHFVGLRQNYYAWEWGNALFVVLDPYWYTTQKQNNPQGNWSLTLGKDQYEWSKKLLESSAAEFKFVFAHQLLGGRDSQGRGGSEVVQYGEMGGLNFDGTWGFGTYRPGWEMPLHQLMVKYHVNVFFHGHDHFYARQEKDGVVYQLVPQPGTRNYNSSPAAEYGYVTGKILPCAGYLKVTVTDSTAKVDYVRSYLPEDENSQRKNGAVEYSYTLRSSVVTSVNQPQNLLADYSLLQNYPNPFGSNATSSAPGVGNLSTTIRFSLPYRENVTLKVFDANGREVATLVDGDLAAGNHVVTFAPPRLTSGIYFYRIIAGQFTQTRKAIFLKGFDK
ncbi:MAG: hypothetical protein DKINENOH_00846 [bacterium]|nr:hypothetical protein [bacterium]